MTSTSGKAPKPSKVSGAFHDQPAADGKAKFTGTDNPRHLRVISALLRRPISREELDSVAGCSNGPDLVAELRSRGLPMEDCLVCERIKFIDRDGNICRPGVYSLTEKGRHLVRVWLARRQRQLEKVVRNG